MKEKIRIVLKAKENPPNDVLKQAGKNGAATVICNKDVVNPARQEVQAV